MITLAIVIALNIPLFLLIAWLIFDTAEYATDTIWSTVVALLQILLLPAYVRVLLGMDDSGAYGMFEIGAFLIACGGAVVGELYLLERFLGVSTGLFGTT